MFSVLEMNISLTAYGEVSGCGSCYNSKSIL